MRIVTFVFSLVLMLSLTGLVLTYVPDYVGQQRIYVQVTPDSTPTPKPYHAYGSLGDTDTDTARTASGDSDPYHQRYYSASEGWTYYTLPASSKAVGR